MEDLIESIFDILGQVLEGFGFVAMLWMALIFSLIGGIIWYFAH